MADKVAAMLSQVMLAFTEEDAEQARVTADLDNDLDEMYGRLIQGIVSAYVLKILKNSLKLHN